MKPSSKLAAACAAALLISAPSGVAMAGTGGPAANLIDELVAWASALVNGAAASPDTGQPGVECDDFANRPGSSAEAQGSAFNEDGKAGTVYAGEQDQNDNNTHSVSQYDTACARIPSNR